MSHTRSIPLPRFERLPSSFPAEGAVRIELEDGLPVFRASTAVQERIEALLERGREGSLTAAEHEELDCYEALDDHFSLLNRLVRKQRQG